MDFIKDYSEINICDIGASPCDATPFIDTLLENTNSKITGFEPNIEEFKKLKNSNNKKYYNYAIGDGKTHNLNICNIPGMTSFLEPNIDYLKLFHGFEKWSKIIKKIPVQTKKLDEINGSFDLIKIDAQGFESKIIKNGTNKIKNSLVVQIETSPIPLYHKEKPFSFVCNQLEHLGFGLHMFNEIKTRMFKPMMLEKNIYSGLKHLLQLDCVFVKNLDNLNKLNVENLKKIILIMFWSFKSYDLVHLLISKLDKLTGLNNLEHFLKQDIKITKNY